MAGFRKTAAPAAASAGLILLTVALAAPAIGHAAKLKTRSKSVALPPVSGPSTFPMSATATCPGGTKAVGGGFAVLTPSISAGSHFGLVYESRRIGQRKWRASATESSMTAGDSITSYAYCRAVNQRIKARANTIPVGLSSTGTPTFDGTATCPPRTKAISGGFSAQPLSLASGTLWVSSSHRQGSRSWVNKEVRLTGAPTSSLTTYVYCLPGRAPSQRSATTTVTGSGPVSLTSPPCQRGKKAGAGGYAGQISFTGAGSLPYTWKSRRSGKRWLASALQTSGGGTGPLTVFAYCS